MSTTIHSCTSTKFVKSSVFRQEGWLSIWRVLRRRRKCSLQVVADRASEQDAEERAACLSALHIKVFRPEMVVFAGETSKDPNTARRRRHCSKRRKTPLRESFFLGDRAKRHTLLSVCDMNGFTHQICAPLCESVRLCAFCAIDVAICVRDMSASRPVLF